MNRMFYDATSFDQPLYMWAKDWRNPTKTDMFSEDTRMKKEHMPSNDNYKLFEYKIPARLVSMRGVLSDKLPIGTIEDIYKFLDTEDALKLQDRDLKEYDKKRKVVKRSRSRSRSKSKGGKKTRSKKNKRK